MVDTRVLDTINVDITKYVLNDRALAISASRLKKIDIQQNRFYETTGTPWSFPEE